MAYEAIKYRVITCAFRPGEYINELKVANLLGFGRTPVHQAFDRLRVEGMVNVIPRKGIIVKPLNLDEVAQVLEARLLIEIHCVRLAAQRATASDVEDLRKLVHQSREALQTRNIERILMLDRDFHLLLASAAKNVVLNEVLANLKDRSLRVWFTSLATDNHYQTVQDEHDDILNAIAKRSPDEAEAAMRRHFGSFGASIVPHL
jgi:GntR family transcriptional regulator, rspAB operon transcriptional repressor